MLVSVKHKKNKERFLISTNDIKIKLYGIIEIFPAAVKDMGLITTPLNVYYGGFLSEIDKERMCMCNR